MSITVGPYTFSVDDARATIAHTDDLLDCYPTGAQEALGALRASGSATATSPAFITATARSAASTPR